MQTFGFKIRNFLLKRLIDIPKSNKQEIIDIPKSNKQETLSVSNCTNSKDHKGKTHQIIISNHHLQWFFHSVGDHIKPVLHHVVGITTAETYLKPSRTSR